MRRPSLFAAIPEHADTAFKFGDLFSDAENARNRSAFAVRGHRPRMSADPPQAVRTAERSRSTRSVTSRAMATEPNTSPSSPLTTAKVIST
jgi:hypothetical protein